MAWLPAFVAENSSQTYWTEVLAGGEGHLSETVEIVDDLTLKRFVYSHKQRAVRNCDDNSYGSVRSELDQDAGHPVIVASRI